MKMFSSKSTFDIDLLKIFTQLDMLLAEQRQQRHDLSKLLRITAEINKKRDPVVTDPTAEELGFSDSELRE